VKWGFLYALALASSFNILLSARGKFLVERLEHADDMDGTRRSNPFKIAAMKMAAPATKNAGRDDTGHLRF
jgi:predicted secreted protein